MANSKSTSSDNQLKLNLPNLPKFAVVRKTSSSGTGTRGTGFRPFLPPQLVVLPADLRPELPANHFVFWLIDLVNSLDLSFVYAKYRHNGGTGRPPYNPKMMLTLIVYGYCKGVTSTRGIERLCWEDIPCRIITGNQKPDHDTISNFMIRHRQEFEILFQQVLTIARQKGFVKLDHAAIDGSKIHANASKHKAMSYKRMCESLERLSQQIEEARKKLEELKRDGSPKSKKDAKALESEIAFWEGRRQRIKGSKTKLEKRAIRKAKAEAKEKKKLSRQGRRIRKIPDPAMALPAPKDQINFTDPQSRIMGHAGGAFEQCYNAQIAVDEYKQMIVAFDVVQQANDKRQLIPMLKQIQRRLGALPNHTSADAGYFSEKNIEAAADYLTDLFVPPDRETHPRKPAVKAGRIPSDASIADRMKRKLATTRGKRVYSRRKCIVEPVYGQIKESKLAFDQFSWRGLKNVQCEWALVCTAHNILRLYKAMEIDGENSSSYHAA